MLVHFLSYSGSSQKLSPGILCLYLSFSLYRSISLSLSLSLSPSSFSASLCPSFFPSSVPLAQSLYCSTLSFSLCVYPCLSAYSFLHLPRCLHSLHLSLFLFLFQSTPM